MSVEVFRVDDRLVHGQVVTAWTQVLQLTHILLVDEEIAKDRFISKILTMMAPAGTTVTVHGLKDGIAAIGAANEEEETRAMVLLKTPCTGWDMVEQQVKIPALCIGGMQRREDREPLTRSQYANEKEKETLRRLGERGIHIYEQTLPSMDPVDLLEFL